MNQPTREEFEAFKQEIRQEVRLMREQRTEEIKITRVEVASADVLNQLKALEEGQQQISRKQDEQFTHIKKEFVSIEERQKRQDEVLFVHTRNISAFQTDVSTIKTDMEQVKTDVDTVKTVQSGHSKFFEEHGKRLAATATKDDIASVKSDISRREGDITSIKTTQEQILKLLQQKG